MSANGNSRTEHWRFVTALLALSLFGVSMIYSAGIKTIPSPLTEGVWRRQAVVLLGAVALLMVAVRTPRAWIDLGAYPLYVVSVVMLAITLVVGTGTGTASGVKGFLNIAGFQFQPAEAAKVTTALALARLLANRGPPERFFDLAWPIGLVMVPLGLVVLQPDLGTALAFVGLFFAAIYWAGAPWPLLLFAASPGLSLIVAFDTLLWSAYFVALALALYLYRKRLRVVELVAIAMGNLAAGAALRPLWESLAAYQRNRILVFVNPELDPEGAGWQLTQSKVAIGSGGFFGKGFTDGPQKGLSFLPETHTDFIFSVVGEELGFVGASLALLGFGYLFFRMISIAQGTRDAFAGVFVFAVLGIWLSHTVINIGMTVGVLPITGIPLPFISYGGSFLLMSWVAAALILALARSRA